MRPGPVHELRPVERIEQRVVEPRHLLNRHGLTAMEQQTQLVPECHEAAGIQGRFIDVIHGKVVLGLE